MTIKFKYCILFCAFIWNVISVVALEVPKKQADSLLKAAQNDVYKNSDNAISAALEIYNNTSYSAKARARALIIVSTAYSSKRDYKKALEYIISAKDFSSQINDNRLQIEILFILGIQYQQQKIYDKSIEYMEEIERRVLIHPTNDSLRVTLAASYLVKGFIYKDNLNCDIALEYFDKGLKEYERIGENVYNRSIGFYNKGNCYILLSEYDNAKESFHKSIEFAQIKNASSLVSFGEKGLAEVYTLEGRYEEAILLLHSALDKSKNVGDLVLNLGIYKGLFENNLALNRWDDYQTYHELFLKTQLEIKTSERNSLSVSIKENSKNLNEELNQSRTKFTNAFKVIILVVIIFIIVVFFLEIKNKKIIKALQKKIEITQNAKPLTETK